MTNDQNNEIIIDSTETNDEVELDLDFDSSEQETSEPETEKPQETLEAKRARLKRQLDKVDRKLGTTDAPKPKVEPQTSKQDGFSIKDVMALSKANVSEDDVEIVEKYAKFEGISITEALKTTAVKAILAEKSEQRNVAEATNVSNARRGATQVSDDALLSAAAAGKLPESDEDIKRLIKAKMGQK